ncbi:PepSY-associated TM helix domain-containing protein [Gordonia zhaorongruii]|uniref:PepSY-associated TM helix domain-containing protein n=1 Tax=Gordonia zhaorongruii TaxID=2597659 RepID=UPI001F4879E3|nr:PepSY-associated TM helix domain-containing protein [Gordonia zhaorongruii]
MRMLHRLHFYAGVMVAPFILIAAVTGALYALAPSIEQAVYADELHTDSTGTSQSLALQVTAAQVVHPGLALNAVRPAPEVGDTTRVIFDDPSLGESERRAVFVDPATLEVRGDLVVYGSSNALPLRQWLDQLHRQLHLGEPGRLYSELAASWMWVIVLAGVGLWISRIRRQRRATGTGSFVIGQRGNRGRNRTVNRHAVIGVWIAVGLVFLSATGLTWSKYAGENITQLREDLSWTNPVTDTVLPGGAPAPSGGEHAGHGGMTMHADSSPSRVGEIDTAYALARSAGLGTGVEITMPAAGSAFTVTEVRAPWQFSPDAVAVDPAHDRVSATNWFADWPLAAKLANLGIALHMGILFGVANQVALFVLAVGVIAMIALGYRAWWQRRSRRARVPVGSAPARGALRDAPIAVSTAVAVIAIGVGWFVPLLGWPLLAFVVIDVAAGRYRARRNSRTAARFDRSQPGRTQPDRT